LGGARTHPIRRQPCAASSLCPEGAARPGQARAPRPWLAAAPCSRFRLAVDRGPLAQRPWLLSSPSEKPALRDADRVIDKIAKSGQRTRRPPTALVGLASVPRHPCRADRWRRRPDPPWRTRRRSPARVRPGYDCYLPSSRPAIAPESFPKDLFSRSGAGCPNHLIGKTTASSTPMHRLFRPGHGGDHALRQHARERCAHLRGERRDHVIRPLHHRIIAGPGDIGRI
jgi:hypothetical protein